MAVDNGNELPDKWEPFRYFLGDWRGNGTGRPGISSATRSYRLILSDQFVEIRGRSVFEPQKANPTGEDHREMSILSYDIERSLYVLREFLVEGYVNQYMLETASENGIFTFVTEAIENLPVGWRARTTLEILSEDNFRETFDLAGPARDWTCYIINEFQRVT